MRHVSNIFPSLSVIIVVIIFWEVAVEFWDIPDRKSV